MTKEQKDMMVRFYAMLKEVSIEYQSDPEFNQELEKLNMFNGGNAIDAYNTITAFKTNYSKDLLQLLEAGKDFEKREKIAKAISLQVFKLMPTDPSEKVDLSIILANNTKATYPNLKVLNILGCSGYGFMVSTHDKNDICSFWIQDIDNFSVIRDKRDIVVQLY